METVIRLTPAELTSSLLENIKNFVSGKTDAEITIRINDKSQGSYLRDESREQYFERLDESLKNLEKGNVITFTAEGFNELSGITLNEP